MRTIQLILALPWYVRGPRHVPGAPPHIQPAAAAAARLTPPALLLPTVASATPPQTREAGNGDREWRFSAHALEENGLSDELHLYGLRFKDSAKAAEFYQRYNEARKGMAALSPDAGMDMDVDVPMARASIPTIPEGEEELASPARPANANVDSAEFQKFLDNQQYTRHGILQYERIFGRGYVSTGGRDTTRDILRMLNLKRGERVLDIGCGIGGGDFDMARNYGVSVVGLDLSRNMLDIAQERAVEANADGEGLDVQFLELDATTAEFEPESFDVVYSRDTILHIEDKLSLFKQCFKWLKPGGRIFISDYCRGAKTDAEFDKYVAGRGYHLLQVPEYGAVLTAAGFNNVRAEDATARFVQALKDEISRVEAVRPEFEAEFGKEGLDYTLSGWHSKIRRTGAGFQVWGHFYGEKPGSAPTSTLVPADSRPAKPLPAAQHAHSGAAAGQGSSTGTTALAVASSVVAGALLLAYLTHRKDSAGHTRSVGEALAAAFRGVTGKSA